MREFQKGALHQAVVCEDPLLCGKEFEAFVKMMQEKYLPEGSVQNVAINYEEEYQTFVNSVEIESHEVTGIVSMENILEYILGIPIMDEKDKNAQSFFIKSAKKRQSLNKSYVR